MTEEEKRKELKAKLSPGYSGREGADFELRIDRIIGEFIDLIERKYVSSSTDFRPVEFGHKMQYFALDMISELGWGDAVGFLKSDRDLYRYVEINEKVFPVISVLLTVPWMDQYLKTWPLSLALPREGDEVGFGMLMSLAKKCVEKRLAPGAEEGDDMMQAYIRNGLSKEELLSEVILELIAGSNSTSTAIRVILLCLLTTLTALQALCNEIDTFGADADVFQSERWLEAAAADDKDQYKEMVGTLELAFGHGKFQCPGKKIALMELNKVFVELLRRYDFAAVTPHAPMNLYDAAFWLISDYHLRVTRRP